MGRIARPAAPPAEVTRSAAGRPPGPIAAVVVLGSAMTMLDMTAVNVAIDHLGGAFGAPLTTVQWVATGFTLALATVVPVAPWAMGRFGASRVYLTAVMLFAAGSLLAGCAWSIGSLVAARVLQGAGGGLITPVGMTLMGRALAGRSDAGRVMSAVGMTMVLGPLAGPTVGGWLVEHASWRWIFLINPPIAAAAVLLGRRVLPREAGRPGVPLDLAGLALVSPGLALVVHGLATAGRDTGNGSPPWALIAGAVLLAAFCARTLTARHPLVDLRLLRNRQLSAVTGTLSLYFLGAFAVMLLTPLYFQVVRGESAATTGTLLLAQSAGGAMTMPFAGRLVDRAGSRAVALCGLSLFCAGTIAFALAAGAGAPTPALCAALIPLGAGGGMTMIPLMMGVTTELPPADLPAATTMINIVQQVFGTGGIALASALAARFLPGTGAVPGVAAGLAGSFRDLYLLAAVLVALSLVPVALLRRGRPAAREPEPAPVP